MTRRSVSRLYAGHYSSVVTKHYMPILGYNRISAISNTHFTERLFFLQSRNIFFLLLKVNVTFSAACNFNRRRVGIFVSL